MRNPWLAFTTFLLTGPVASAHELKVLASQLAFPAKGDKATVFLSWGHRLPVDDLVEASTVERYDLVSAKNVVRALEKSGASLQTNVVDFAEEGIHQIAVNKRASVFHYVIDAGGNRQLRRGPRPASTKEKIESSGRSRQCAKAIVVVGRPGDDAPKPLEQPLEIVPLDGPAKWKNGAILRFRVLLDGKPSPSAEVAATYFGFHPSDAWRHKSVSGQTGEGQFALTQPGTWVIKARTQRPAQGKDREHFDQENFTATLSLDVAP